MPSALPSRSLASLVAAEQGQTVDDWALSINEPKCPIMKCGGHLRGIGSARSWSEVGELCQAHSSSTRCQMESVTGPKDASAMSRRD